MNSTEIPMIGLYEEGMKFRFSELSPEKDQSEGRGSQYRNAGKINSFPFSLSCLFSL